MKIKRKRNTEQGPRDTRHEWPIMPTQAIVWTMLTSPSNSGLQPTQSVANQGSSPEAGRPGFSLGFSHVYTTDFSL